MENSDDMKCNCVALRFDIVQGADVFSPLLLYIYMTVSILFSLRM